MAGQINPVSVEAQQHAAILPGEIFDLIDFVEKREATGKVFHAGELGVFHNERRLELTPGMAVEIAAEHLSVLGPTGEGDRGAANADETFSFVANEGKQVRLLRRIHVEVAVGKKDNRVEAVQVFGLPLERLLCDRRAIGPQIGIPQS